MPITRRQRQVDKLAGQAPAKRDVLTACWFPDDPHWREHDQERRVGIGDHELLVTNLRNLDAQLLM